MSDMIQKWESDDIEASEFIGWACTEEEASPSQDEWQKRYEEAIIAGDYIAARYAKAQIDN